MSPPREGSSGSTCGTLVSKRQGLSGGLVQQDLRGHVVLVFKPHPHPCSSLVTGTLEAFNLHPLKWAAFLTVIQEDGPGASWPPADSPGPWGCCGNVRNGDGSNSGASGRGGGRSAPPPRGCHARGTGTRSGHAPDSSWQRAWGASRDRETPAGPRCRHEAVCLPGEAGLAGAGAEGR